MPTPLDATDRLCVDAIRVLSIDAVQAADSGHPGLPLGAAPMAYVLWQRHLKHDPGDPNWPDRDRFVLSAGHGSMLLYSLLHLTGYAISLDDLKQFRQWGSKTPGHPEVHVTPGVEATTGPLGQGVANAVGMAIAERRLASLFNRPGFSLVDHHTYALVGDGDLMEGISAEASSLAGHLGLGKLIVLYDDNQVTLDGPASLAFSEDVGRRYEAYGWQVLEVERGDTDLEAIDQALIAARSETARPSLVMVRTTLGYGSPNKSGKSAAHGSPLGSAEVALTRQALSWPLDEPFAVPERAAAHLRRAVEQGALARAKWGQSLAEYAREFPDLAALWRQAWALELPEGWDHGLPAYRAGDAVATRTAGGGALNAIATKIPYLLGGDADLSVSTSTALTSLGSFEASSGQGRNLHFGVREHAMAGIANGIAYHGGLRSFVATFLCFSDYMRPSIRLAALGGLPVIYVWTHDSIGLGEDGPTHQPVEHLMSLRTIPGFTLIRPADATETVAAWKVAIQSTHGPVGLVLSRQKLPVIDRTRHGAASGLERGAYVLAEAGGSKPRLILIATGSEVQLALAARQQLEGQGIPTRVVSMPSFELFERQEASYRDGVLLPGVQARVAIEAGSALGWWKFVGLGGAVVGLDRFGASAHGDIVMSQLGFTVDNVVNVALAVLKGLEPHGT